MELLAQIMEVVVIPLLGILTAYIVKLVNSKLDEVAANRKNELEKKYLDMLSETITDCVIATTQTYVDALKKKIEMETATEFEKKLYYGYFINKEEILK